MLADNRDLLRWRDIEQKVLPTGTAEVFFDNLLPP
jgi:hypothetical protein